MALSGGKQLSSALMHAWKMETEVHVRAMILLLSVGECLNKLKHQGILETYKQQSLPIVTSNT